MTLLLFLLTPSLGLPLLVAQGEALPLLFAFLLYYLLPFPLYALGRRLPFRPRPLPPAILVFLLPYWAYWAYLGAQGTGLPEGYRAFLRGPGLALPLVGALGWGIGVWLPPWPTALSTFLLLLLGERFLKAWALK